MSEFKKKSKSYLVHVAIGWISVRFVYVVFLCGYLNLIIMGFFQMEIYVEYYGCK